VTEYRMGESKVTSGLGSEENSAAALMQTPVLEKCGSSGQTRHCYLLLCILLCYVNGFDVDFFLQQLC
jgi:hypothetical protein